MHQENTSSSHINPNTKLFVKVYSLGSILLSVILLVLRFAFGKESPIHSVVSLFLLVWFIMSIWAVIAFPKKGVSINAPLTFLVGVAVLAFGTIIYQEVIEPFSINMQVALNIFGLLFWIYFAIINFRLHNQLSKNEIAQNISNIPTPRAASYVNFRLRLAATLIDALIFGSIALVLATIIETGTLIRGAAVHHKNLLDLLSQSSSSGHLLDIFKSNLCIAIASANAGIFGSAFTVLVLPFILKIGNPSSLGSPEIQRLVIWMLLSTCIVSWLYYSILESSKSQATIGKRMIGLVVTDLNGDRISFYRASLRWLAKIVSVGNFIVLGYLIAFFTEKKQTVHDLISGCLVVPKSKI